MKETPYRKALYELIYKSSEHLISNRFEFVLNSYFKLSGSNQIKKGEKVTINVLEERFRLDNKTEAELYEIDKKLLNAVELMYDRLKEYFME